MKIRNIIIIGLLVGMGYIAIHRIFSIRYSQENIGMVETLQLDNNLTIRNAYIVMGKNYNGFIEAAVFPSEAFQYNNKGKVDYMYLRFDPQWYQTHLLPQLVYRLKGTEDVAPELVQRAEAVNKENFSYFSHFSQYPVVRKGVLYTRISFVDAAEKVSLVSKINPPKVEDE